VGRARTERNRTRPKQSPVTVSGIVAALTATTTPAAPPLLSGNSTHLNRTHPHGLGRVGDRDRTSDEPVTTFKRKRPQGQDGSLGDHEHACGAFRRALDRGNAVVAEIEARGAGSLDLDEAVQLIGLIALRDRGRGAPSQRLTVLPACPRHPLRRPHRPNRASPRRRSGQCDR
jgi:hypothetical protein